MTQITGDDWHQPLRQAISDDDRRSFLAILESRATAHAGTPKAEDKRLATRLLRDALPPDRLLAWTRWLAEQPSDTAKEMACFLAPHVYEQAKDEMTALLQRFADDANWEVREWAGSGAGDLLHRHFGEVYPAMQAWAAHPEQFVRRAVAIAVRGAADAKRPERAEPLLQLMDTLAGDPSEEVRRNTGPFAVGGCLLGHYPEQTLTHVRRWASSDYETHRWNAAMVFVAANARHHIDTGLEILSQLAGDERRLVWMAVASALKNIVKRDPDRVIPIVRQWLSDGRKLPAALALRHTTLD